MWEPSQMKELKPEAERPAQRKVSCCSKQFLGRLTFFIVALMCLLPRLSIPYHNGQYLWAEDGIIYIDQAKSLVFGTLYTPYAGYLQTYSRLVALVGDVFPLQYIPSIYIVGWLLAFFVTIKIIVDGFQSKNISYLSIFLAICLMLLQPNNGEIFFNNVNAQWFIGLALAIYLIIPRAEAQTIPGVIATFVASISGPFSLIYLPIVVFKISKKTIKQFWAVYSVVLIGALIQASFIVNSDRTNSLSNIDVPLAIKCFFLIFTFGAERFWLIGIGLFWILLVYSFIVAEREKRIDAALLLLAGMSVWAASIYAQIDNISSLAGQVSQGDRYTFIPYATFILSFFYIAKKDYKLLLLSAVCILPFFASRIQPTTESLGLKNIDFNSYVDFASHARGIIIPENPMWPTYPGWYIDGNLYYKLDDNKTTSTSATTPTSEMRLNGIARELTISAPAQYCHSSNYIGVEVNLYQQQGGWLIAKAEAPNKNVVVDRYYPEGSITAQFAFPYYKYSSISIISQGRVYLNNVKSISIYCPGLQRVIVNKTFSPRSE
jgi:hypothetical protein